jgi:hypothetical protein
MAETQIHPEIGIRAAKATLTVLAQASKAFQAFIISVACVAIGGVMGLLYIADPETTTFSDFLGIIQSPPLLSVVLIVSFLATGLWMMTRGFKL